MASYSRKDYQLWMLTILVLFFCAMLAAAIRGAERTEIDGQTVRIERGHYDHDRY